MQDVFANFEAARIFGYTMLEELRELLYQGEEMFFMKHLHPDICFEMWGMMMTRQERRMEHRSHMFDRNGTCADLMIWINHCRGPVRNAVDALGRLYPRWYSYVAYHVHCQDIIVSFLCDTRRSL